MVRVSDARGALFVDPHACADMDDGHRRAAELRREPEWMPVTFVKHLPIRYRMR